MDVKPICSGELRARRRSDKYCLKNGYKLLDSYGLVAPSEGVAEKRKKFSQDLRKISASLRANSCVGNAARL